MRVLRFVPAGFAVVLLCGCGGGGGGSSSDQNALVQGRAAVNQLASGQTSANAQTLQRALDLFLQALKQDPRSAEAHFGAAICLAGKIAEEVDGSSTEAPSPPAPPEAPGKPEPNSSGGGIGGSGGGTATPPSPPAPPASKAAAALAPAGIVGAGVAEPGEVVPAPPGVPEPAPIPKHRTLGLLWNLDNSLANPYVLLHMLAPISDLRLGFAPYFGYPHDNAARRQQMLDGLNMVADHLAQVEADPNFSVTLPDVDSNGKTVTVGLPEVYMFDAYVQSLRAKVALSLAYIRDSGTGWAPPTELVARPLLAEGGGSGNSGSGSSGGGAGIGQPIDPFPASLDKNKDGKLTPDEYLPASPYLTLRDAKVLQTSQQAMLNVVDRESKGIDGVLARSADGSFLIPNVPAVQAVLGQIRDKVLPLVQQAANGPFTIEVPRWHAMLAGSSDKMPLASEVSDKVFASPGSVGGGGATMYPYPFQTEPLKVNLAAWFTSPPADLKVFAPTFTLTDGGWPDPAKTVYPDKTFGGLFPDGIKDDLPF